MRGLLLRVNGPFREASAVREFLERMAILEGQAANKF